MPKDFVKLLVILYYDKEINKKCPSSFILLNNKNESSYYKVFKSFKSIITLEGVNELELISYSTDYEIDFLTN